jgi:hypothetical protein
MGNKGSFTTLTHEQDARLRQSVMSAARSYTQEPPQQKFQLSLSLILVAYLNMQHRPIKKTPG